ncbi:lysozyme inhibitor LprI family protein, partial [Burkholderia ubonensis]|uniref:lysozyme inhibitor LprI family protein n=1 Tax=Burkholderia ubonensis TaxID=101571 RepID=UPI0012F8CDCB
AWLQNRCAVGSLTSSARRNELFRVDWVAFRDAECDFRTSVSGGAHQWLIVNRAQCLAELTEQRTKVLDDYLKRAQDE